MKRQAAELEEGGRLAAAAAGAANVEDEAARVMQRVVSGAAVLLIRQVLVHGTNVLGAVLLARFLAPADYGLFAVVNFLILFLGAFGGTGFAANLIREHPQPSSRAFRAVYTFQQIFSIFLATILWFGANAAGHFYRLGTHHSWTFRLVALTIVAVTMMVPPQVKMERRLDFRKLAFVETAQAIVFNVLAVLLAYRGWGDLSFGIALLARFVLGAAMANVLEPVSLRWNLDWGEAFPHLRFGFYFQASQLVAVLKDSITPVLVGYMFGASGVGFLSWASVTALYPVLALVVLQRIYLPAFAKLQHDSPRFGAFLENLIWATNAIAAPLAIVLLVLIRPAILIVYGGKWLPALPLFYWFWLANLFVPTTTPVQTVLNAVGKAKYSVAISTMWMLITWGAGWPLSRIYGPVGIAMATFLVQLSSIIVYRVVQTIVPFRLMKAALPPWLLAAPLGGVLWLVVRWRAPLTLAWLTLYGVLPVCVFAGLFYCFNAQKLSRVRLLLSN